MLPSTLAVCSAPPLASWSWSVVRDTLGLCLATALSPYAATGRQRPIKGLPCGATIRLLPAKALVQEVDLAHISPGFSNAHLPLQRARPSAHSHRHRYTRHSRSGHQPVSAGEESDCLLQAACSKTLDETQSCRCASQGRLESHPVSRRTNTRPTSSPSCHCASQRRRESLAVRCRPASSTLSIEPPAACSASPQAQWSNALCRLCGARKVGFL